MFTHECTVLIIMMVPILPKGQDLFLIRTDCLTVQLKSSRKGSASVFPLTQENTLFTQYCQPFLNTLTVVGHLVKDRMEPI